ncbi:MGMT family protein [Shewanella aestuarii]|uniref:Cysteine methyltransferase n=1 Tax=Shewanella aestuarii TaxID=1028752 RepID=A0A6G9QKW8_9GAMM|nr:MGMT family protein [Shewanella aestuarii]QIR14509.1 cysteine methyltransferase [Shewanella aestuarii]
MQPTQNQWTPVERICFVVNIIPRGKVLPYGKVADLAGLPGRARFVSRALKLSQSQDLPWHRVINSAGKIAFPNDSTLYRLQIERLRLEDVQVNNGKILLSNHLWQPDMATLVMTLPF